MSAFREHVELAQRELQAAWLAAPDADARVALDAVSRVLADILSELQRNP